MPQMIVPTSARGDIKPAMTRMLLVVMALLVGNASIPGGTDRGGHDGGRMDRRRPPTAYVAGMASLGDRDLAAVELMRLAIIDVTPTFVRALAEVGYRAVPLDDIVKFRIHRVTPEFVRSLHERNLSRDAARGSREDEGPQSERTGIDELKALGYTGLDIDQLVKLRIQR